jgi:hypothetical protein
VALDTKGNVRLLYCASTTQTTAHTIYNSTRKWTGSRACGDGREPHIAASMAPVEQGDGEVEMLLVVTVMSSAGSAALQ